MCVFSSDDDFVPVRKLPKQKPAPPSADKFPAFLKGPLSSLSNKDVS